VFGLRGGDSVPEGLVPAIKVAHKDARTVRGEGFGDRGESVEKSAGGGGGTNVHTSNSDIAGGGDVHIEEDRHAAILREGEVVYNSAGEAVSDVDEHTR